jgi:hypothetical protein
METHVKVLGWFNIAMGVLGVLFALTMLGGSFVLTAILSQAAADADIPAGVIQMIAIFLTILFLALSLPSLILGVGLLNLRQWARVLGIVLCALHLLNVPIGTAISLYGFWVLLKPETEALFRSRAVQPTV